MPHYIHFTTIFVVGVRGVVSEFSTCEGQLTLLFATLCLIVAKLATISALGRVVLTARSGMAAPPSSRRSVSRICNGSRSCVPGVSFGCFGLGLIGPFFHGLALFLHPNSCRASICQMRCLSFRRDFLPPLTSTSDRIRREVSPSRGLSTVWHQTMVLSH